MRYLLKSYAIALPCFLLFGSMFLFAYPGVFQYFAGHDESLLTVAVSVALAVIGFLTYLPISILYGAGAMGIAPLWFVLYIMVARARALDFGMALSGGVLAGIMTTAVRRAPELLLEPQMLWKLPDVTGGIIVCGLAGVLTAWILRRWTAPAERGGTVAQVPLEHGSRFSFAATSIAFAIALLTTGTALYFNLARTESVLLVRDATAAAQSFRAASADQQATLIAGLMARPGHKASINAEKLQPEDASNIRPIRDRAQLKAELAAIRARLGPVLSTKRAPESRPAKPFIGDGPLAYAVGFRDRYANAETEETLYFELQGRDVVLTVYNLLTNAGGETTRFVGLLVSR